MSKTKQADESIHEDQLLNFLVKSVDEEVALNLGENAQLDARTSVTTLCENSEDSPHENTVLYHLREKFDLETIERIGNSLLQKDVLDILPEQVEVVVDLHLRPYYGDEDDTEGLYHSEAKRGTTAFHAYATLYARVRNKRYTLAVRRLVDGDPASSVLAEFLGLLDGLDVGVKGVYLDREFYDSKCLTLLQAHNYAYVMPIVRWGKPLRETLRYRGSVSALRAKYCDNDNAKSGGPAVVCRGESPVTERLAVLALGERGDAPPWRASPLVVVVHGVHQDGVPGSVDGPRGASGRPRKSAT